MLRTPCACCNSMFYADDEDYIEKKPYCSYCIGYILICDICRKHFMIKKRSKMVICEECKKIYHCFNTIFSIKRFIIFKKDCFTCRYCGRSPLKDKDVILHCDHIIPRAKGGTDDLDNLITSCGECNKGKTDIMLEQHLIAEIKRRKTYDGGTTDTSGIEKKIFKMENSQGSKIKLENIENVGKGNNHS